MNTILFSEITLKDLPQVGGKNASTGEMCKHLAPLGIRVPAGFAITAAAFRNFLDANKITGQISGLLNKLDKKNFSNLAQTGKACRALVNKANLPVELVKDITLAYANMEGNKNGQLSVAVRSSATAEDLPDASFAGQHDSFLNITGTGQVLATVKKCFASLYNDRAIKYRCEKNFDQTKIALSVGVQKMIRSDKASAGVAFTIEPETGFGNLVYITGVWGLGENIVQGAATPDEYYFFKPSLRANKRSLITKKLGEKAHALVFAKKNKAGRALVNILTPAKKRIQYVLSEKEAEELAKWCLVIEEHYKTPMDIEWAKDGKENRLYIVQARPETVHGGKNQIAISEFKLLEKSKVLVSGKAVGTKIVSGIARILKTPAEGHKLKAGEILITDITNPDWNAVLKKASVIVTNKGGRTSHASIVAREFGLSAVVGTLNATQVIRDGQQITVSCAEGDIGKVYEGKLQWSEKKIFPEKIRMPQTDPMFILADPGKALFLSSYPNKGVGLLRMEFIINNSIGVHPMALTRYKEVKDKAAKRAITRLTKGYPDKKDFFIEKLAEGIAMVAAAFYPKDVIVRMSDFKTNEYANLLGGKQFEPGEENPMIGFRGASRYYNTRYKEGFGLECAAIKRVRNEMGLTNVKLMIPFCRTVEEGKKVIEIMEEFGLKRGEEGLEIYVMAEVPSNVILAEEFARIFDGFSIGSNDLTQLTLGIDRDSAIIGDLFSERNAAPMCMIRTMIRKAKKLNIKIGLCGQAPSDYPEFAQFLVEEGIDSISFNPDALLKGIENINAAEAKISVIQN